MEATKQPGARRDPLIQLVRIAVVLVLALEALEETNYRWHRMKKLTTSWWAGVEHRERAQLHRAEIGFLAKRLPSRVTAGRRGA
jgi:hypothetical protein